MDVCNSTFKDFSMKTYNKGSNMYFFQLLKYIVYGFSLRLEEIEIFFMKMVFTSHCFKFIQNSLIIFIIKTLSSFNIRRYNKKNSPKHGKMNQRNTQTVKDSCRNVKLISSNIEYLNLWIFKKFL